MLEYLIEDVGLFCFFGLSISFGQKRKTEVNRCIYTLIEQGDTTWARYWTTIVSITDIS